MADETMELWAIAEAVVAEHIHAIVDNDEYVCDWCAGGVPMSDTIIAAQGDKGRAWQLARDTIQHEDDCLVIRAQTALTTRSCSANEPRAIVRHFAAAMARKLAANDATKGDWRDYDWMLHYRALMTELGELLEAIQTLEDAGRWGNEESAERENVLAEAADCANYLMMICDVVGALPPTDERGRLPNEQF